VYVKELMTYLENWFCYMKVLDMLTTVCNQFGYSIIDAISEERLADCLHAIGEAMGCAGDFMKIARDIKADRAQLNALISIPVVEQRSDEWHRLRQNLLTASDLAQALGKGKFGSRADLLKKKVTNESSFNARCPPLKWGTMFEDMVMRCYQQKSGNVPIHNFGLSPHQEIDCFGASPDGITALGVMVEIKAPYKRKIEMGKVPEQYFYQIQGQLSVCKLTKCDYVEAEIAVYDTLQEYREKHREERVLHGIIIEYMRNEAYEYLYSPPELTSDEAYEWVSKEVESFDDTGERHLSKITPWRLSQINIVRVQFDENKWDEVVPHIKAFWNEVSEGRLAPAKAPILKEKKGQEERTSKYKKPKYEFADDD
jgi:putative phage-type endonuclease